LGKFTPFLIPKIGNYPPPFRVGWNPLGRSFKRGEILTQNLSGKFL